jgi:hypothetical protein
VFRVRILLSFHYRDKEREYIPITDSFYSTHSIIAALTRRNGCVSAASSLLLRILVHGLWIHHRVFDGDEAMAKITGRALHAEAETIEKIESQEMSDVKE